MTADVILTGDGQVTRHFTITADHDITGEVAQVSFSTPGVRGPDADFVDATTLSVAHVPAANGVPEHWVLLAEVLFGPDGVHLDPGDYKVFGKLVDMPERPIEPMGYVRVS